MSQPISIVGHSYFSKIATLHCNALCGGNSVIISSPERAHCSHFPRKDYSNDDVWQIVVSTRVSPYFAMAGL